MANVITVSAALSLVGTGVNVGGSGSFSANQVGTTGLGGVQAVGTAAELLLIGDAVPAGGYLFIYNQDATNYVEVDSANTFDKFPQKITAGKFILLMPQTSTIYLKANTGACNCWCVPVTL